MKIHEDHTKENKHRLFISSLQGSQPPALAFGRDSKAGREVGTLYSKTKGKLWMCSDGRLLEGGAELTRCRHLMWLVWVEDLAFSGWCWVERKGSKIGKLTVIHQIMMGLMMAEVVVWLPATAEVMVRDSLSYIVWPFCPFIYSISHAQSVFVEWDECFTLASVHFLSFHLNDKILMSQFLYLSTNHISLSSCIEKGAFTQDYTNGLLERALSLSQGVSQAFTPNHSAYYHL